MEERGQTIDWEKEKRKNQEAYGGGEKAIRYSYELPGGQI